MLKRMMKCLVCGAVFELGAAVWPVLGVGPGNFVPVDPGASCFRKDTQERILILGAGTAGLSAGDAIRERNATCSITMVSNERTLPYHRPMLTKDLFGKKEPDAFAIHSVTWYTQRDIHLITDEVVASLDALHCQAALTDGTLLPYDKCIYALGAKSFIPPFPGADLPECVAIRTMEDREKVHQLAKTTHKAVVIGGGVLGLEAAWELKKAGLSVTVLEGSRRLLSKQLDEPASILLYNIAEKRGVNVLLEAVTQEIESDGCGHVAGVRLANGNLVPGGMVVISTGVRPNVQIAKEAGAEIGRAVKVNQYMETTLPGVYACGDCAEFMGVNYSIWPEATRMGLVAGMNAAGEQTAYTNPLPGLTLHTLGTQLFAIGDLGGDPQKSYTVQRRYDPDKRRMRTDFFVEGVRTGAIRIGDLSDMEELIETLGGGI